MSACCVPILASRSEEGEHWFGEPRRKVNSKFLITVIFVGLLVHDESATCKVVDKC
jgi:hypothetical protein